ncbi:MAG: hypothetical protein H6607_10465 [Flavobacteriales bacterium]|nr:hypothetical protein [Flavobacteriales bacterium]
MKDEKNIEWKLFELLENELSEAEELEILSAIEADEELACMWQDMQATKLTPPNIVYNNKESLLKRETKLIAFAGFGWMKYAAAVVIMVLSYPLWKSYISDKETSSALLNSETPNEKVDEQKITPIIEEESVKATDFERITHNSVRPKSIKPTFELNPTEETVQKESFANDMVNLKPIQSELNFVRHHQNATKQTAIENLAIQLAFIEEDGFEFQGVRTTLNNSFTSVFNHIKGIKIDVEPIEENKNKAWNFSFQNNQYTVSALVSLKPLNDK